MGRRRAAIARAGQRWPGPARLIGLHRYPRSWLRGDLLAGVTVAAYLVPQVMAYAQVAGLHPAVGLWAAVPALVIYAAFGSSRSLSLGPESTTALMTAAAIGPLVLARPLLASFPQAALAAIVIYAATRLIDVQAFRRLVAFRRGELVIAGSALAGVLAAGILYGVLIAIAVSVAELLLRVARPHDAILGLAPGLAGMHDVDDYPQARTIPGLVVYRYDAPLFFANAQDFRRRALAAARCHGPPRWFVLNVEANVEVDFTALEAVEALRDELARDGTVFALARVKQDLLVRLKAFGLAAKIGCSPPCPPRSPPTSGGPPSRDSAQARNLAHLASLPEARPAHPAIAGHNTAVSDVLSHDGEGLRPS